VKAIIETWRVDYSTVVPLASLGQQTLPEWRGHIVAHILHQLADGSFFEHCYCSISRP
jgi:hypothetical protein